MEKLAFSLVIAARMLRPYFQAYVINVLIDHPLKKAMNKLEATGRLIQQAMELSEFNMRFRPGEAKKAQALVDFIAKFTPTHDQQSKDQGAKQWAVRVDGLSTQHAGGIGIVLQSLKGDHLEYVIRLQFQMTNNEDEYKTLLQGLELIKSLGVDSILVQVDSQLVIGQMNEMCEAKEERMKKYLGKVKQCIKGFTTTHFQQIPSEENVEANILVKAASIDEIVGVQIKVQYIPSIDVPKVNQMEQPTRPLLLCLISRTESSPGIKKKQGS